jgi:hypothetical protein
VSTSSSYLMSDQTGTPDLPFGPLPSQPPPTCAFLPLLTRTVFASSGLRRRQRAMWKQFFAAFP